MANALAHMSDSGRTESRGRRDFLRRAAPAVSALALAGLSAPVFSDRAAEGSTEERAFVHFRRRAMGCVFEVVFPAAAPSPEAARSGPRGPSGSRGAQEALDRVDALDRQLSIYREDSEVSALNRRAGAGPVVVEAGLFALLEECERYRGETAGAFDVVSGGSGESRLHLDPAERTVSLARGSAISFDAVGKGYAVDRAAALLRARGVEAAIVNSGHSSMYAIGAPVPLDPARVLPWAQPRGWRVRVERPEITAEGVSGSLGTVWLRNRALGTSALGGRREILDPRTGAAAGGARGVTVLAPTAAAADALSTAFMVLGAEGAADYCRAHADIGVLMYDGEKTVAFGTAHQEAEITA